MKKKFTCQFIVFVLALTAVAFHTITPEPESLSKAYSVRKACDRMWVHMSQLRYNFSPPQFTPPVLHPSSPHLLHLFRRLDALSGLNDIKKIIFNMPSFHYCNHRNDTCGIYVATFDLVL